MIRIQIQSRLQSLWRLSYSLSSLNDLQSLPTFFDAPMRRSQSDLQQAIVRLQGVSTISPTKDPFEFRSSSSSVSTTSSSSDPQLNVSEQDVILVEDMMERSPVVRNPDEIRGSLYYQLDFSITCGSTQQSLLAILEIPPTYPLRTPQILLTPRSSSSAPSTHSYSYVTTLRAIEQEVNAGCLLFFETSPELLMNSERLEGALDSVLSIQVATLISLLSSGASIAPSATVPVAAVIGKSRSSRSLSKMYGRHFNGTA